MRTCPILLRRKLTPRGVANLARALADFNAELGSPRNHQIENKSQKQNPEKSLLITFSPWAEETSQASWGREEKAALLSPPRSDEQLFLKTEEGKSTCSLDGSCMLERKLSHCERRENRTRCVFKLGSRFLFFFSSPKQAKLQ